MFFVDKPYVSDFLKQTLNEYCIPVVDTEIINELNLNKSANIISQSDAINMANNQSHPIVYMNSENAINWISENLSFCELPKKINLFKDKLKFRELTKTLYPDLFFKGLKVDSLKTIKFDELPTPFIIKPTVGFFSMGVYKVNGLADWEKTINLIEQETKQVKDLYPIEVLNTNNFIVEEYITGEEFALDAYFDKNGDAVVLSILRHTFASEEDVSDRVYTTSKEIIEDNLEEFTDFVNKIGQLTQVKNFPVHIELRRNKKGMLLPIEVNPMRFGGWCTTADMSYFAYGFNQYHYYYTQQKPDWSKLLNGKEDKLYSVIVLDNSTGVAEEKIKAFNYDKLMSKFNNPLELRKIDHNQYPLFGFLFTETNTDNFSELQYILDSDLTEFISLD